MLPPTKPVADRLSLLKTKFCEDPRSCVAPTSSLALDRKAAVLAALALIESGIKYEDAIEFIRQKSQGGINSNLWFKSHKKCSVMWTGTFSAQDRWN
uniref:Uncharacterized protein n=1 Tax=Callorhinchus milii TaxID=7868 RepID=A0A4W3I693_CALMI